MRNNLQAFETRARRIAACRTQVQNATAGDSQQRERVEKRINRLALNAAREHPDSPLTPAMADLRGGREWETEWDWADRQRSILDLIWKLVVEQEVEELSHL